MVGSDPKKKGAKWEEGLLNVVSTLGSESSKGRVYGATLTRSNGVFRIRYTPSRQNHSSIKNQRNGSFTYTTHPR